jgi:hypothetical protein
LDNGESFISSVMDDPSQVSESIRPPFVDTRDEIVRGSRSKLVGEPMRSDIYERKSFLDPSLRAELSTSVSLSIPRCPGDGDIGQLSSAEEKSVSMPPPFGDKKSRSPPFDYSIQSISQSSVNLANSTYSACLSPSEPLSSSNTLDQSFYISRESIARFPSSLPWRAESEFLSQG